MSLNLATFLSQARMLSDPRAVLFFYTIHKYLRSDPTFSLKQEVTLLRELLRTEKVVKFGSQFVINSFAPPLPSKAFWNLFHPGGQARVPLRDLILDRRPAPFSVYLSVTDRCNYQCEFCSARFTDPDKDLHTEQWTKIVRSLQSMGTSYIGFTGGEPLLRADMEDIVRSVDDRSATVLFTNGSLVTAERAKSLKDSGLFALSVSLDSADRNTHNKLRGESGAYNAALAAIEHARRAGLYTIVQSVIYKTELSQKKLFKLFRLVRQKGAHEIRIHQPARSGAFLDKDADDSVFYTDADRQRLFKIQAEANQRLFGFPRVTVFPFVEGPDRFGCGAGLHHAYVTAKGEFCPCDFIPMSFGNLTEEDAEHVWQEMSSRIGHPRMKCWAAAISGEFQGKTLPLPKEESQRLACSERTTGFPRFFRELQK